MHKGTWQIVGAGDLGLDQSAVMVSRDEALRPKEARVQPGLQEGGRDTGRGLVLSTHHRDRHTD